MSNLSTSPSIEISFLVQRAKKLWAQGDKRNSGVFINEILKEDFSNTEAWGLLYEQYGNGRPFEIFLRDFANRYYPGRLPILEKAFLAPKAIHSSVPVSPQLDASAAYPFGTDYQQAQPGSQQDQTNRVAAPGPQVSHPAPPTTAAIYTNRPAPGGNQSIDYQVDRQPRDYFSQAESPQNFSPTPSATNLPGVPCVSCGWINDPASSFCGHCGYLLKSVAPGSNPAGRNQSSGQVGPYPQPVYPAVGDGSKGGFWKSFLWNTLIFFLLTFVVGFLTAFIAQGDSDAAMAFFAIGQYVSAFVTPAITSKKLLAFKVGTSMAGWLVTLLVQAVILPMILFSGSRGFDGLGFGLTGYAGFDLLIIAGVAVFGGLLFFRYKGHQVNPTTGRQEPARPVQQVTHPSSNQAMPLEFPALQTGRSIWVSLALFVVLGGPGIALSYLLLDYEGVGLLIFAFLYYAIISGIISANDKRGFWRGAGLGLALGFIGLGIVLFSNNQNR